MSFLSKLVKELDDENTSIMSEGLGSAEFSGFIDSGCYMLNAVLSGSLFGGLPNNKVTMFAGEPSAGKTYLTLDIVKSFLASDKDAAVIYYDTEGAVTEKMMASRGIDTSRVVISEPETIQDFKTNALKTLDLYEKENDKTPLLFVLDSLGQLPTNKEMEDSLAGNDTRDMTRAQAIKSAFRTITLKLARNRVPMIVTNHVYDAVGSYIPTKNISGGSGAQYAASQIALLSKRKDKDGTEVVGNLIKVKMHKSRLSIENKEVELELNYKTGLNPYYGLLEYAEKYGLITKLNLRSYEVDGVKKTGTEIRENPESVFTKEFLEKMEAHIKKDFSYGG